MNIFFYYYFFIIKVKNSLLLNTFENNFDESRCNDGDSTLSTQFH